MTACLAAVLRQPAWRIAACLAVSAEAKAGEVVPLELLSLVIAPKLTTSWSPVWSRIRVTAGRASVMAVVSCSTPRRVLASGKASLEFAPLAPGAESPFIVRLPKTTGVTRFRVGFRAQDGSVVAHVDRRGQPVLGTTRGTTEYLPKNPSPSGGL